MNNQEAKEKLEETISKDNWRDKLLVKGDPGTWAISDSPHNLYPSHYLPRHKPEHTFKEKEHAQLLADKMNLMQEMHAFAHVRNEGWEPDWDDAREKKWGIYNGGANFYYGPVYLTNSVVFGIVVKSVEIVDEMFQEFGERIEAVYNRQY